MAKPYGLAFTAAILGLLIGAVFDRLAGTWTYWGWKAGYFSSEDDASAFYDEMR